MAVLDEKKQELKAVQDMLHVFDLREHECVRVGCPLVPKYFNVFPF